MPRIDTQSRRLAPTFNFRVTLRRSATAPSGVSGTSGTTNRSTRPASSRSVGTTSRSTRPVSSRTESGRPLPLVASAVPSARSKVSSVELLPMNWQSLGPQPRGVPGTRNAPTSGGEQLGSGGLQERMGGGGFQECSGLDISMNVLELQEGGRNAGVIQRVGHGKYQPLVLKRGMFYAEGGQVNPELWTWLQNILTGTWPVPRYDGVIEVLDRTGDHEDAVVLATWTFDRGLPAKLVGPQLNARTGEIALEELHIAHEGLRLSLQS